jgi:hypothetical protein
MIGSASATTRSGIVCNEALELGAVSVVERVVAVSVLQALVVAADRELS